MNITNFLQFVLTTNENIKGLIFADTFRMSRHIFDSAVSLLKEEDIKKVSRRADFFELSMKNGNNLIAMHYSRNNICGRRTDFIINYDESLSLNELLMPLIVCSESRTQFIYNGNEDKFDFIHYKTIKEQERIESLIGRFYRIGNRSNIPS